jgi:hypothetical protein
MSTPGGPTRPWPRIGLRRRSGPVLLIVVSLIGFGILSTVHPGDTSIATDRTRTGAPPATVTVPPTYAVAEHEGRTADYNWGPQCDPKTGRIKMPTAYAPPCVPVFSGNNGGSTWSGVSETSINVVYYQPPPGGLSAAIQGATGTPATNLATARAYVDMLNHTFEMYGRKVNLIDYNASGPGTDTVAAHADAVRVAQDLHAFASIGGPNQTSAYSDELAHLHVLCIACGSSATYAAFQQDAPYLWGDLPTADTLLNTADDYLIDQLNGKAAIWAGNPAWRDRKRSFAVVNVVQSPPLPGEQSLSAQLNRRLTSAHVNLAMKQSLTYQLDLTTLPDQAATIAAKLKASNATTVVFAGDPIMPIYLTKACARIGYFPEWVITGTVFTDTSTLGRYYNQREWAHAFGISSLAVPTPVKTSNALTLYQWWYGGKSSPPAIKSAAVILQPLMQLFDGIDLAGAHLTPSTFAAGLFRAPPAGGGPTTPLVAYGTQGAPPTPSYSSPADYTFIWYNATARGPDEQGTVGTGLMEYAQDGKRYRAGTVPSEPVPMFSSTGSVTHYPSPQPGDGTPSYAPWPGSPAVQS